jgi:hypothetical protein
VLRSQIEFWKIWTLRWILTVLEKQLEYKSFSIFLTCHGHTGTWKCLPYSHIVYRYSSPGQWKLLQCQFLYHPSGCVLHLWSYCCNGQQMLFTLCTSLARFYTIYVRAILQLQKSNVIRSQTFILHYHQGQNVFTNFIGNVALINIALMNKTWSHHATAVYIHILKISSLV